MELFSLAPALRNIAEKVHRAKLVFFVVVGLDFHVRISEKHHGLHLVEDVALLRHDFANLVEVFDVLFPLLRSLVVLCFVFGATRAAYLSLHNVALHGELFFTEHACSPPDLLDRRDCIIPVVLATCLRLCVAHVELQVGSRRSLAFRVARPMTWRVILFVAHRVC